ncbi:MAG TPA: Bax inhibitor-1/YccA family protein [Anaerolineales bacterium]|nr:Bax inhibitor-1/YccA family protein [Anaerolineales bacterium]
MNQSAVGIPTEMLGLEIRPLLRRVYLWMTVGVLLTAIMALLTVTTPVLRNLLLNPLVIWGALIGEFVLVIVLSAAIRRLSPMVAALMFFAYAGLLGFSLSAIFFVYDLGSIALAFLSASALFGMMTFVGFATRADLTKLGTYLIVGLFGLILATLLNLFVRSSTLDLLVSIAGVVVFTGLTAYDTQKIARMAKDPALQEEGAMLGRLSILGALTLYLDFVNLFLFLLRLLGRRR